jgi:hypothetical protein
MVQPATTMVLSSSWLYYFVGGFALKSKSNNILGNRGGTKFYSSAIEFSFFNTLLTYFNPLRNY